MVERSKSASPWSDYSLAAGQRAHRRAGDAAWTKLSDDGERATFSAGAATIELHRTETTNYRGNLTNDEPLLWVVLRPSEAEMPYELC